MNSLFVEHDGGRIAYDDQGNGPLVVCVPAMGDMRGEYRFLAPELVAAGYRVVTLDVRGHGESSTLWNDFSVAGVGSDILAIIRFLQAGPAIVIGASMAAGAAVWAAAEAPQRVSRLVLIGPAVRGELAWPGRLFFRFLFGRPWGPSVWKTFYATLYPTRKPADFPDYSLALQTNLRQPGRMEAVLEMIVASKAASHERLSRVKTPALILMGTKDPDFKNPESEARWVANQLKSRYHMIVGAGHHPHAELPEVVLPEILSFLSEGVNVSET